MSSANMRHIIELRGSWKGAFHSLVFGHRVECFSEIDKAAVKDLPLSSHELGNCPEHKNVVRTVISYPEPPPLWWPPHVGKLLVLNIPANSCRTVAVESQSNTRWISSFSACWSQRVHCRWCLGVWLRSVITEWDIPPAESGKVFCRFTVRPFCVQN